MEINNAHGDDDNQRENQVERTEGGSGGRDMWLVHVQPEGRGGSSLLPPSWKSATVPPLRKNLTLCLLNSNDASSCSLLVNASIFSNNEFSLSVEPST